LSHVAGIVRSLVAKRSEIERSESEVCVNVTNGGVTLRPEVEDLDDVDDVEEADCWWPRKDQLQSLNA